MDPATMRRLGIQALLQLHGSAAAELRRRGVVRSANNPIADYSEFLVCRTLGLSPATSSTKGFDATDSKGKRLEIKSRRQATGTKPTRFSAIRDLDGGHFHYLVAVLFRDDYAVERAAILTLSAIRRRAFFQKHVNGWILPINDNTWTGGGVRDITEKLRRVQSKI